MLNRFGNDRKQNPFPLDQFNVMGKQWSRRAIDCRSSLESNAIF